MLLVNVAVLTDEHLIVCRLLNECAFECLNVLHVKYYAIGTFISLQKKKVIKSFFKKAHNLKLSKDLHLVHLIQAKLIFVSVYSI